MSFDRHSTDYSEKLDRALTGFGLEHDFFLEAKVHHILEARRRLGVGHCTRVLEIGCGTGLLLERLRPLVTNIRGMDLSVPSLAQASVPNGRLIAADGLRSPFADESFDLVIAVCVLHHVPLDRRAGFLSEAVRITRRGGRVLLCEHNPWNPLTRVVVSRCELDSDAILLSEPEARRRLIAAGLSGIRNSYILLFPWRGAFWRWLESRLRRIPLGAQYVIEALRR